MLTDCAYLRGAANDPQQLARYAVALAPYDVAVVQEMLTALGLSKRQEGEAALPDVGNMLERIRAIIRSRRPSPEEADSAKWLAYLEAAKAEGITEPDAEMLERIAALNEKHGLAKAPKVIDTTPVLLCCPHCSQELPIAPNIRFWEPEELEALAGTMRSNRALAAANRAASLAAQASPLSEVPCGPLCNGDRHMGYCPNHKGYEVTA
jgi:hypothetical protein